MDSATIYREHGMSETQITEQLTWEAAMDSRRCMHGDCQEKMTGMCDFCGDHFCAHHMQTIAVPAAIRERYPTMPERMPVCVTCQQTIASDMSQIGAEK